MSYFYQHDIFVKTLQLKLFLQMSLSKSGKLIEIGLLKRQTFLNNDKLKSSQDSLSREIEIELLYLNLLSLKVNSY